MIIGGRRDEFVSTEMARERKLRPKSHICPDKYYRDVIAQANYSFNLSAMHYRDFPILTCARANEQVSCSVEIVLCSLACAAPAYII